MSDNKLANMFIIQKSLTEWLEDIKHNDVNTIRAEDNEKRERLGVLNEIINLPYDRPTQFSALDLHNNTANFQLFIADHGTELCSLRLMSNVPGLPKLRTRGSSIIDAYEWFKQQTINPTDYSVDFTPHALKSNWATIFIVNKHGIQGEIIAGGHNQLTQGFHDNTPPIVFRYDFKKWTMNRTNNVALAHLKQLAKLILVTDNSTQQKLTKKLGSTFINNYIEGYFETTNSDMGTWFIDYNQSLGKMYANTVIRTSQPETNYIVSGQTGSSGSASGKVVIVPADKLDAPFPTGSILVCAVTTPDYVPLMQKAAAIVTDQGGILSHAAIIARELGVPCIVGTSDAVKKLRNGQVVIVDADNGVVK